MVARGFSHNCLKVFGNADSLARGMDVPWNTGMVPAHTSCFKSLNTNELYGASCISS